MVFAFFYALVFISFTDLLKITEWLRLEMTLLKQGHLEMVTQDNVQTLCEHLQGGRSSNLSGQIVQVLS